MQRPQMALPYQDASWWVLAKLDSALVSAAEGTSAAWYRRDPRLFRSLGWRSLRRAPSAATELAAAGSRVPCGGGGFQLACQMAGDLRSVAEPAAGPGA